MLNIYNLMEMEALENEAYSVLKQELYFQYDITDEELFNLDIGELFISSKQEKRREIFAGRRLIAHDEYKEKYLKWVLSEALNIAEMIKEERNNNYE